MAAFTRYIGIDYSGAQTPTASLKGLRVYLGEGDGPPAEIYPPPSPRKYWTRKGVAHWLVERLAEDKPTLGQRKTKPSSLRVKSSNVNRPETAPFGGRAGATRLMGTSKNAIFAHRRFRIGSSI